MPARVDNKQMKSSDIVLENIHGHVNWHPIAEFDTIHTNMFNPTRLVHWYIYIKEKHKDGSYVARSSDSVIIAEGKSNKEFDEVVTLVKAKVEEIYKYIYELGNFDI